MKLCTQCASTHSSPDWRCPACGWRPPRAGRVYDLMQPAGDVGFHATHLEDLTSVESDYFWFAARNALILWALERYLPGTRTFLEVGCGNGQVLRALHERFPGLRLTASEAFAEGLAVLEARLADVELLRADVRRLPFDGEFDVVGAFDVLEHVDDDIGAMREIARSAAAGGGVIVTVPQHPGLWSEVDAYSGHRRRYTRSSLRELLQAAGLRVVRMTSFVTLLLPALLLARTLRRGRPVDPFTEYRIPGAVNALADAVMGVERRLIRAGVSFPAGGSLLAVARR